MPLSLKDLIRRGDVCFFCGYTIGIEGQTTCPECGRTSPPSPELLAPIQRAVRIGWAGIALLLVTLAALGCWCVYHVAKDNFDPRTFVLFLLYALLLAIVGVILSPWWFAKRHEIGLFRHAWRRRFTAAYPWVVALGLLAFITFLFIPE